MLCGCGRKMTLKCQPEHFVTEVLLKTTPVKDQGSGALCWIYAMCSTIETEHLMLGDSVNLSPDYVARMFLREQAYEKAMKRKQRGASMLPAEFTTRGVSTMALRLIQTYGLQHYDAYHRNEGCNYNVLARRLQLAATKSGKTENVVENVDRIMDDIISPLPLHVYMKGVEYTPLEFAHSVCRSDEYVGLTSFSHHPFGSRFALEVPDNRYHDTFLNVPIDTLMNRIEGTLRSGHPVCWEGDTSEPGFDFSSGVARLGNENEEITQEHRQTSFETGHTTDDHCMTIVGIAHDDGGNKFFICKNSWGTGNPYGGFMYLSMNYVRLKTVAVVLLNDWCRPASPTAWSSICR